MEKFKLADGDRGLITDFPLEFRKALYEEIMSLIGEADKRMADGASRPGCVSENLPIKFIFGPKEIMGFLTISSEDLTDAAEVMTFRITRDNLDNLLKDNKNENKN
jgi:hypothetical protein